MQQTVRATDEAQRWCPQHVEELEHPAEIGFWCEVKSWEMEGNRQITGSFWEAVDGTQKLQVVTGLNVQ